MPTPADATRTTVVDCTFRDGGYYNDWEFAPDLIHSYVRSMTRAEMDVVELGFRTSQSGMYAGPTAFTTDEFIDSLDLSPALTAAVMVNAKEFADSADPAMLARKMFRPANSSRVDLVRIAAHHSEVEALPPATSQLKELGYQVAVNLMQISDRSLDEVATFGRSQRQAGIDVAYIADSFGGLRPADIPPIIHALKDGFEGPVGCHLHDNMTYALASTLAAVEAGATWVDGTLLGMGRGPGNVRTEYLVMELARLGLTDVDVLPLVDLVESHMVPLQREFGWGSNSFYFLSALYGVHPTYVMEMTRDGRYGTDDVVSALESLREGGGAHFKRNRLSDVTSDRVLSYEGTYEIDGWCTGRDVMLIGPGPSAWEKRSDIERYIRSSGCLAIGLNAHSPVDTQLLDAVAVCHPTRAAMDAGLLSTIDRPVFAPEAMLDSISVKAHEVRDVGIDVTPGRFGARVSTVEVPRLLVAAYGLALAVAGGASRVLLVGFDGFPSEDPRQGEMVNVFESFAKAVPTVPVISLTRTNYPVEHSSLYAPIGAAD